MKKTLFLALAVLGGIAGFTQTIDRKRLDSLFGVLEANNLAIGSITITQDGKPVYQRNFGKGSVAGATYRIGSISKIFTAVMIYELIDQKKLLLIDTLSEFFPQVPNAGQITIAELLGHRSGIADFTAMATGFDHWKGQAHTHDQLVGYITSQDPAFSPGAKADYNNSNFLLLGYILESIYQKSYKEIVTERIINKLGLPNTYYGDHSGFQGKEAASYKYSDSKWQEEKAVYLDNFGGAGGMISTPDDLCKFVRAIFDGKFISKASVARMTQIEKDGYGWGMFSFGG
jgi:D-alanyl-D-alanine carboxypeptidase